MAKFYFVKFICLNIFICVIKCENSSTLNQNVQQFTKSLNHIFTQSNERLSAISSKIAKISQNLSSQNGSQCFKKIQEVLEGGNRQEWSSNLIYSNSFIQFDFTSNILSEQYTSLGNFDKCLSRPSNSQIDGKYCLVTLRTPQLEYQPTNRINSSTQPKPNTSFTEQVTHNWLDIRNRFLSAQGICAPELCSEEQLGDLIKNYFKEYLNGTEIQVNYCQQKDDSNGVGVGYVIASFFIQAMVALSIFTTLIYFISNIYSTSKLSILNHETYSKILQCFDISYNVKCLFNYEIKSASYQTDFRYLNGLRTILIFQTVASHCLLFLNISLLTPVSLFSKYPSFYYQFQDDLGVFNNINKKYYAIMGLFFIISGFINTFTQLKNVQHISSFPVYVTMRWIRMVPSILGTICLTIVMQKTGSGPLFHEKLTDVYVAPCYNNWWTNLLLINNFWTLDKACGMSLWYAAANFQLSLLLYPILRMYSRNFTYAVLGCLALASITFSSPILAYMDWAGIPVFDHAFRYENPVSAGLSSLRTFYTTPLIYLLPYFLGAIVAMYLLNARSTSRIPPILSDAIAFFLLMVGFLTLLLPLANEFKNQGNEQKNIFFIFISLLYYTLVILALFFAIILFSQTEKSIGKTFLSARVFQFLNQLSYGIYLINPLLLWFNVHQNRQVQELTMGYIVQMTLLVYFESILLAIFLFIFFESPFRNLSRVLKIYFLQRNARKIEEEEH